MNIIRVLATFKKSSHQELHTWAMHHPKKGVPNATSNFGKYFNGENLVDVSFLRN